MSSRGPPRVLRSPIRIAESDMADEKKATRRKSFTAQISPDNRVALYAVSRRLPSSLKGECKLQIPFTTYMQDPEVAKKNPGLAFNEKLSVDWEPGLTDGPTSARFAVVDYNADTDELTPPAE